jgi:hypothetical protein
MHHLILQTRRPSGDDPGAVEYGYWIVQDRRALNGGDPKAIAINLMRSKMFKRKSDFNRPLKYPRGFY